MLPLTETKSPIRERLASELTEVEAHFCAELVSDLDCVNDLVGHVERYRGKMLRPTLLLVSGMAAAPGGGPGLRDAHRVVAAVVEMVHMATLVHDDILDEADTRRHGETVNRMQGNETAVMLGDYLISHAYHLCSGLDQPMISRIIADATNTVCEGELLQLANRNNWSLDVETYFEIIRRKTASLCGTCCRIGGVLHDAPRDVCDALYAYGENVGVAFQIVDDLLDLVGDEQTVGKTLGRDIQKGKLTLPLIRHLAMIDGAERTNLMRRLERIRNSELEVVGNGRGNESGNGDDCSVQELIESVRQVVTEGPAVDDAKAYAGRLVEEAKTALAALGDSEAASLLGEMADAVISRRY